MYQISQFWNNCKNKVQRFLEVQNNSDKDKRIVSIENFLLKDLNLKHKGKDHLIRKLIFVRDSQLNIGSIQCQTCFEKQQEINNFCYSLDLIKILEDVYYFLDQVSLCFENDQQYLEEQSYHQIKILNIMKETFQVKVINKDIIWKINNCILEIEVEFQFNNENAVQYLGKNHYQNIRKCQMNKILQNIKTTQKQIHLYRKYIKLLPTTTCLRKFHSQSEYCLQQTISDQYFAILVNYQIIIYNIQSGINFSKIDVEYENNNILLFQFTQDEKYLIFAYENPNQLIIFNLQDKTLQKMKDQYPCLHMECQTQNNQNYLYIYNYNLTIKQCIVIEQLDLNNFLLLKKWSYQKQQIQTHIFYDKMENKWKSLIKYDYQSIVTKKVSITKIFKLQLVQSSKTNRLFYSLISNSTKKIRKVASSDQSLWNSYILSKDETFIISSSLSFYEISTGKIVFVIRLYEQEELQDVRLSDNKVKILTWDNLYVYDLNS